MFKKILGTALIATTALIANPVQAETALESAGLNLSSSVGFFSDYAFRGISQTNEGISLQGSIDLAHDSGFYVGAWGSNVDFQDGDEAQTEIDLYAGYANTVGKFNYDVGVIYYTYPGATDSLDYDYFEIAFGVGYDFDKFSAGASINYSPEYFGDSGDAIYYAAGVDVPVNDSLSLSANIGYQDIDDNAAFGNIPDYTDWSLGVNYNWSGLDLSLTYVDTDIDDTTVCEDICDERFIVGVSRSF